jgi:hypothetical protein
MINNISYKRFKRQSFFHLERLYQRPKAAEKKDPISNAQKAAPPLLKRIKMKTDFIGF